MIEIEFSAMGHTVQEAERLLPLLERFEREKRIHVNLVPIAWSNGWQEIANMAIYRHGADISEVGATWISSLVSMNAVQPLSRTDVNAIGGTQAFYPTMWQTSIMRSDPEQVWAVPWHAYPIVFYYDKNQFEKVGVDPQQAFQTPTSIHWPAD